MNKIDTHHHYLPEPYVQALHDAGEGLEGVLKTPSWSAEASLSLMDSLGISRAILSVTTPGPNILQGAAAATLARACNEEGAKVCAAHPTRFGFFAAVPSPSDTAACLAEIRYALDTLGAAGVALFTSYDGGKYLGHPSFAPVWAELDARAAVVFVHPTGPPDAKPPNPFMPGFLLDFPQETARAAADMIISGTKRAHPRCKIILSHMGGTLPFVADRMTLISFALKDKPGMSKEDLMADAKSFYFDTALSTSKEVLDLMLEWVGAERLLFGSDFPYAPAPVAAGLTARLEAYKMSDETRRQVYVGSARILGLDV